MTGSTRKLFHLSTLHRPIFPGAACDSQRSRFPDLKHNSAIDTTHFVFISMHCIFFVFNEKRKSVNKFYSICTCYIALSTL